MLRYILKQLAGIIPTILIVTTFVFFFVRMIPGNPARVIAGPQATLEDVQNLEKQLGLDKPVGEQYVNYIKGLFQGDMGTSLRTKKAVTYEIGIRYKHTVALTLASLAWSSVVGVLIGVWSGRNRGKWQDYLGMTTAVSGISLPSFWIAFLLLMFFAAKLRILPASGVGTWKHLILPSFTLGVSIAAIVARFTRSSIIETLKEDYIKTARAKGASERRIIWKHAFRNSLISVVTVVGLQFGHLLGGSVVVETVFAYQGLGSLLVESVLYRDYPLIQSLILIFSLHFIIINFIIDVLYALLKPDIRLS